MRGVFWLLPLLAMAAAAADVTGNWSGVIEVADSSSGTTINTSVRAEFEQKAGAVTGKIGRGQDEQAEPIRNGKVEGSRFSFDVSSGENSAIVRFDLTVSGDRIEGVMKGTFESAPIAGKVRLTRRP